MQPDRLDVTLLVIALFNVLVILELVRRRRLHEKYALLWLSVAGLGIVLSLGRSLVDRFARAVGIAYGPTVIFVAAILFLLLVCIQLSLEVSRLRDRTTRLAQEIALIRNNISSSGNQGSEHWATSPVGDHDELVVREDPTGEARQRE